MTVNCSNCNTQFEEFDITDIRLTGEINVSLNAKFDLTFSAMNSNIIIYKDFGYVLHAQEETPERLVSGVSFGLTVFSISV